MHSEARVQALLTISAILLAGRTLLPDLARAIARGQLHHCRSNLRQLATALELYSADNRGRYPFHLRQLLRRDPHGSTYLRQLPTCPSARSFSYKYLVTREPDTFRLFCCSNNHGDALPRYPQTSSDCRLIGR